MKKQISVLMICILSLLCFCMPANAMVDAQLPLRSYDGTTAVSLTGNVVLNIENNVSDADKADDPVYLISGTATKALAVNTGENYITVRTAVTQHYARLRISMDVKSADGATGISIRTRSYADAGCSSNNGATTLLQFSAAELGSGWNSVALDLCADGTSGEYTVWLNGNIHSTGTTKVGFGLNFARIQPICENGTEMEFYLDNIVMSYAMAVPEVLSVNQGFDVDYGAESFTVELDGAMGEVSPSDIVLNCGDDVTPVGDITVQGNTLLVTPQVALMSGSDYILTLKPTAKLPDGTAICTEQSVGFVTTPQPLDIVGGELVCCENGVFSGTYLDSTSQTSAIAVVVTYDANGRIINITFSENISSGEFNLPFTAPDECRVKAFCVTEDFEQVIGNKIFLN